MKKTKQKKPLLGSRGEAPSPEKEGGWEWGGAKREKVQICASKFVCFFFLKAGIKNSSIQNENNGNQNNH